uniref:Uncharacterized protein n=1 Tax=Leptocylindrus danicus TaxID=163516 RepID=A0A7S2KEG7_9STRA|mmetsp:Transcript_21961/g.32924  ORF Transcript_21961/g.32924 Transcript_21961/m.32924 type:complete len:184 (+) Transcript_21961:129-680(+)|eukprot:CAMPEP_0116028370 /NCGR_PEP_ID=MMETSP0321-20121206/15354_1 /TAXON_ID=163516 /ORGANISM="Leptocylindrus danicus var. danicus, Strain B650" /LENGTH=183 /DNA_ID=CAMNT_0003502243 /DNA_START=104 /DNA_END=655 /DNA_ORIENTATION=+
MTDCTDLSFYLNFIFLNSSELVTQKVKDKIGFLGGIAAKAINADAKITEAVSSKLSVAIPEATKEMGLKIVTETVFKQGPVCVVKFTIDGADPVALINKAKGEDAGNAMKNIIAAMDVLGVEGGAKNVENKMLPKVKAGLMEKLSTRIPAKMEEAGLKCKCVANEPAEQADWFYNALKQIGSK